MDATALDVLILACALLSGAFGILSIWAGPYEIGKPKVLTPGMYLVRVVVSLASVLVAIWTIVTIVQGGAHGK